jgi:hypothetical protein
VHPNTGLTDAELAEKLQRGGGNKDGGNGDGSG